MALLLLSLAQQCRDVASQNRGLPPKWGLKPSDHSIPCLASRYVIQIYTNGSLGSNARIEWIEHLWGKLAEFSPTSRGLEGVYSHLLTAIFSKGRT